MEKKKGFIAISLIYSFFLCFLMLMAGMLANYAHTKLIVNKINEPLTLTKEPTKSEPETPTDPEEPQEPGPAPTKPEDCENNKGMDSYLYCKILDNPIQTNVLETDDFKKGYPNYTDRDSSKSGLYKGEEDHGTSYYFRGEINNNNVIFANIKWKILRINGDGSIRLIYNEDYPPTSVYNNVNNNFKYVGYTYDNSQTCTNANPCVSDYDSKTKTFTNNYHGTNSAIKDYLEKEWYMEYIVEEGLDDKVALTYYCNDTSYGSGVEEDATLSTQLYYGTYQRIVKNSMPSLKCPDPTKKDKTLRTYGGVYKLKVGLANVDELCMAGISYTEDSYSTNYLHRPSSWLSMSPYISSDSFSSSGERDASSSLFDIFGGTYMKYFSFSHTSVEKSSDIIPVINLKSDVLLYTDEPDDPGTEDNPYYVE